MKKFSLLCVLLLPVLFLTGCMHEFDSVFDGTDKAAIAPIGARGEAGSVFLNHSLTVTLVSPLLAEYGLPHDGKDYAFILNDAGELKDVEIDGTVYRWPEIDFGKYSLVVGRYWVVNSNESLVDQRIIKKIGSVELFLEIGIQEGTAGFTTPFYKFFAALYPKLPDDPVKIRRWNNF